MYTWWGLSSADSIISIIIWPHFRWMNNLDKRKAEPEDDDILDELQMEVRTEEQAIDHINEKVQK